MSKTHDNARLPALRALQVFEAAARLASFTRAGHELGVSQGAVSRQVQELERDLGAALFVRSGPQVRLTPLGMELSGEVTRAFSLLQHAVARARPDPSARFITLSMLPSLAAKWLAPRLGKFTADHPEIDLRIMASRGFVDFRSDGVDAAIRYGRGNWDGLDAVLLARETVTPVCAPAYRAQAALRTPADLARATVLHTDIAEDWHVVFAKAGLSQPVPKGPHLGDDAATLQAAIDGQGVALGRSILVADDLRVGRLIAPFDLSLPASFAYWFVSPTGAAQPADLRAVLGWLGDEFAATGQPNHP
ncbi:MAG: transcriptional regulator GcvA [Pseudomonadota bacterium]